MENNRTKKLALNTLLLIFCCVIIALFCLAPNKTEVKLDIYKVNFDTDGGTSVVAIEVPDGSTIERPEDPTRDGYEFIGWMLGDELYDFSHKIDKDITLKANWQELKPDVIYYTVTFDSGGGTPQGNQIIEAGKTATKPIEDPVKENFTFEGWTFNGNPFDFATPITSDITLVAGWKEVEPEEPEEPEQKPDEISYIVTFNTNGGSAVASQTVKEGETVKRPSNPKRSGYTFKGWYTSLNGSKTFNFNTKITKSITIYAQWNRNSSSGGGGNSGGNGGGTTPAQNDPEYRVTFNSNYKKGNNKTATETIKYSNRYVTTNRFPLSHFSDFTKGPGYNAIKNYYNFSGWSESSSGSAQASIEITRNKTVYAVWTLKNNFIAKCIVVMDPETGQPTSNCRVHIYTGSTDLGIPSALYSDGTPVRTTCNTTRDWPKFIRLSADIDGFSLPSASISKG